MASTLQLSSLNIREDRVADNQHATTRPLGSSELSYFLPSRGDGVNDMQVIFSPRSSSSPVSLTWIYARYLHLGFRAPAHLLDPTRLATIWAIQRAKHPLLAAGLVTGSDVGTVQFEYTRPNSVEAAITMARSELDVGESSKDDLLSTYLNGPRLLSTSRTSYLFIARDPASGDEWHLFLCALHCIGDGMALHTCANEMLSLLGTGGDVEALKKTLEEVLERQTDIPRSMEDCLPNPGGQWKSAAAKVNEELLAGKQIGGQAFPRAKGAARSTVVPTVSFDEARTKRILGTCKANGVSVSNAVFALCNIAWARLLQKGIVKTDGGAELPSLFYTALNTRPWLDGSAKAESFFRLCIGYFNVILPTFIPSTSAEVARTFWHRARLSKIQSTKAVKSPFILVRTHMTAVKRAEQSIVWAKIDDRAAEEKEKPKEQAKLVITGLPTPAPTPKSDVPVLPESKPASDQTTSKPKPAPSAALMGLSLLGNLDAMYKHATYGEIKLHTLTTGSRQRPGAMLLFGYTFAGKLWLCFGYDENGFPKGVVEAFWSEVLAGVDEFLGL
ncbi:hypothetical protein FRC10_011926 [Ceratobasidium sp. 414]|nr:hypothetical protein FRC10_011926 [Ceratobasidium sp. 414]